MTRAVKEKYETAKYVLFLLRVGKKYLYIVLHTVESSGALQVTL